MLKRKWKEIQSIDKAIEVLRQRREQLLQEWKTLRSEIREEDIKEQTLHSFENWTAYKQKLSGMVIHEYMFYPKYEEDKPLLQHYFQLSDRELDLLRDFLMKHQFQRSWDDTFVWSSEDSSQLRKMTVHTKLLKKEIDDLSVIIDSDRVTIHPYRWGPPESASAIAQFVARLREEARV